MSANMSVNTGKYCWCLKTNKNQSETEKLSSPFHRTCLDRLPNPCLQQLPMGVWSQPPFPIPLRGGRSDTLPVFTDSLSATTWDASECQWKDRRSFFFPWYLLPAWFSTSTFFWSLLHVNPAVLYRIFFIPTCKWFFPPSCYYDYPLS